MEAMKSSSSVRREGLKENKENGGGRGAPPDFAAWNHSQPAVATGGCRTREFHVCRHVRWAPVNWTV